MKYSEAFGYSIAVSDECHEGNVVRDILQTTSFTFSFHDVYIIISLPCLYAKDKLIIRILAAYKKCQPVANVEGFVCVQVLLKIDEYTWIYELVKQML